MEQRGSRKRWRKWRWKCQQFGPQPAGHDGVVDGRLLLSIFLYLFYFILLLFLFYESQDRAVSSVAKKLELYGVEGRVG